MNTLKFIEKRQRAFVDVGYRKQGTARLNCDFLVEKFGCKKTDSHTVHGDYMEIPPFTCKFSRDAPCNYDLLAVATEEGEILMLNGSRDEGEDLLLKQWPAHSNAIFDVCWLPGSPLLLSASGDHTISLFDVSCPRKIATFIKHTASVKSVATCPAQPAVFASGSRDGTIIVWDMRVGMNCSAGHVDKPDIIINDAHLQSSCGSCVSSPRRKKTKTSCQLRSVTDVTFQDEYNLASAGVSDAAVKIWDLRKTYVLSYKTAPIPKQTFCFGENRAVHGCSSLQFDSTRNYLFACCTNNTVARFDCRSGSNQATPLYYGFRASSYFVKMAISPDDQYIVCGSGDNYAHIWKVSKPGPPMVSLSGHSAEVTAVDWHPRHFAKLATCSDDNSVFVWNICGQEEDLQHASFVGSTCHITSEVPMPNMAARLSGVSPVQTSPRNTCFKERSLTEFFRPTGPCSPSVILKTKQNTARKDSDEVNTKPNILQSSTNILTPHNRKRKMNENENDGGNSERVIKTSVFSPDIPSLNDSESSPDFNKENKENNGHMQKNNTQRSPLSLRTNKEVSPTSAKKMCHKRLPMTPPSATKQTFKDKKPPFARLITSYFQASGSGTD